MKKFFLSMLAVASLAGTAVAQEVVATVDYSKLREYPFGDAPDGVTLVMENQCLNASGSGWWQFKLAEAQLEPESPYTISVCIKADKKGATQFAVGNWSGDDWQGLADDDQDNKIKYTDKWAVSSCVLTTKSATNPLDFMFQPGGFDGVLNIAWVVISKGHCEPEWTPLMPVDLSTAESISEVNFSELSAYPFDGDSAAIENGLLVNKGDDIFNVMQDLTLEEGKDYGIIAKVKSSADVEVGVSMGDWGCVVDGSFLAYDAWNQPVIRLGNAPVDEEGKIPENCFVMFSPEDGFEGTIEVEWVKLVVFPEPVDNEPKYETVWTNVLDNLTGENGESENVYCRYGENGAWTDDKAGVCDDPAGSGSKVFFCEVPAHPIVAEGEEDPIPDHHRQFFVQYPDNKFHEGDSIHVKFDYYETAARNVDTQSHMSAGDYILWHFIGSFTAEPKWQTYETTVEVTNEMVKGEDGQGCIAFNLCTKLDEATIFYMNNITIDKGELVLVSGELPQLEWQSIITNGDANNGASDNIISRIDGNDSASPVVDDPAGSGKVFEAPFISKTDGVNDWDSQMFIAFDKALEADTEIKISFEYYSTIDHTMQTQAHGTPGNYHHWSFVGNLESKPEWQTLDWSGTISSEMAGDDGCKALAINLSTGEGEGKFYLKNVKVEANLPAEGQGVEKIEAEKVLKVYPAGVYNLQGVKVANSIDEVAVPGLYITNGKKVIKK